MDSSTTKLFVGSGLKIEWKEMMEKNKEMKKERNKKRQKKIKEQRTLHFKDSCLEATDINNRLNDILKSEIRVGTKIMS